MEYNTQRDKLPIIDYGRTVQKLIEIAEGIPTKERRGVAAKNIVDTMAQVSPQSKDVEGYERRLWDHLMIMSGGKLDVDMPYPFEPKQQLEFAPKQIPYGEGTARYPHYGKALEQMVKKAATMEEGEERENLVRLLLRQMKLSYLQWNNESVEDGLIVGHLKQLSDGVLEMPSDYEIVLEAPTVRAIAAEKKMSNKKKKRKR